MLLYFDNYIEFNMNILREEDKKIRWKKVIIVTTIINMM